VRRILPLSLCGLLSLCACAPSQSGGPAANQPVGQPVGQSVPQPSAPQSERARDAAALLAQAATALREIRATTDRAMLDEAIGEARALIILPGIYQAGFIYSVQGGAGVLVARRGDGGWGAPVFVNVAGAGYGLQAGLEKSRLVLAIMEEEMLARLLDNGLSLDIGAMYDVLGVREETSRGTLTHRPVEAFGDGVGIMAGLAFRGGVLQVNNGLTRDYHGRGTGNAQEIMRGTSAPGMEVFALWSALGVAPAGPEIVRVTKR